eukprot:762812-Hanusia_phi.AAC.2
MGASLGLRMVPRGRQNPPRLKTTMPPSRRAGPGGTAGCPVRSLSLRFTVPKFTVPSPESVVPFKKT